MSTHNETVNYGARAPASPSRPRIASPRSYVTLTESDGEHGNICYFVRREGNEEALRHLQDQLEEVGDWRVADGVSAFRLDLDHPVSAAAVGEMLKLGTNRQIQYARLDGVMQMIDLRLAVGPLGDHAMARAVSDAIGYGRIAGFFD